MTKTLNGGRFVGDHHVIDAGMLKQTFAILVGLTILTVVLAIFERGFGDFFGFAIVSMMADPSSSYCITASSFDFLAATEARFIRLRPRSISLVHSRPISAAYFLPPAGP